MLTRSATDPTTNLFHSLRCARNFSMRVRTFSIVAAHDCVCTSGRDWTSAPAIRDQATKIVFTWVTPLLRRTGSLVRLSLGALQRRTKGPGMNREAMND